MNYGIGWDQFSEKILEKLVTLMDSNNLNVKGGALRVGVHLATSKNYGYPGSSLILLSWLCWHLTALSTAMSKVDAQNPKDPTTYARLIDSLKSTDVHILEATSSFINNMLSSAPDKERTKLLQLMERHSLSKILKQHFQTADTEPKTQIRRYLVSL